MACAHVPGADVRLHLVHVHFGIDHVFAHQAVHGSGVFPTVGLVVMELSGTVTVMQMGRVLAEGLPGDIRYRYLGVGLV